MVSEFRGLIENWHVSNFHIADARPSAEAGYSEHLSTRGDNVAQVPQYLYENHTDCFNRLLEVMSQRVPGVSDVEPRPTEDGRPTASCLAGSWQRETCRALSGSRASSRASDSDESADPRPRP